MNLMTTLAKYGEYDFHISLGSEYQSFITYVVFTSGLIGSFDVINPMLNNCISCSLSQYNRRRVTSYDQYEVAGICLEDQ